MRATKDDITKIDRQLKTALDRINEVATGMKAGAPARPQPAPAPAGAPGDLRGLIGKALLDRSGSPWPAELLTLVTAKSTDEMVTLYSRESLAAALDSAEMAMRKLDEYDSKGAFGMPEGALERKVAQYVSDALIFAERIQAAERA